MGDGVKTPGFATHDRLKQLRVFLRDSSDPARLRTNPLAAEVCSAEGEELTKVARRALDVALLRITQRQRSIVVRHDICGENIDAVCEMIGLSKRQFFRDHQAALSALSVLLVPTSRRGGENRGPRVPASLRVPEGTPWIGVIAALRGACRHEEALEQLARLRTSAKEQGVVTDCLLTIAEISIEQGEIEDAWTALRDVQMAAEHGAAPCKPRLARRAILEGHLRTSHVERIAAYERAVTLLESGPLPTSEPDLLANAYHAISLSLDHQGAWLEARVAAHRCMEVVDDHCLRESQIGLIARANHAMRDSRQFGVAAPAARILWACLALALRDGRLQVIGEIAVHFMNLCLMHRRYVQALRWHRWVGAIDASRFVARTRNFLAVDRAHALTMLGRPADALLSLQRCDDHGLAFLRARDYWRGEALHAAGEYKQALRLGLQALAGAEAAQSHKGRARANRLVAKCWYSLGRHHSARKTMAECLELSGRFVSPYDLLLSLDAASRIMNDVTVTGKELRNVLASENLLELDAPSLMR